MTGNNNDKDNIMSEKEKKEMIKKEIEKYRNNQQIGTSNTYIYFIEINLIPINFSFFI